MSGRWSQCGRSWILLPEGGRRRTSSSNTNAVGLGYRQIFKHKAGFKTAYLRIAVLAKPAQTWRRRRGIRQRWTLLAESRHTNLANGRPILSMRTSGLLDAWTCTPKEKPR